MGRKEPRTDNMTVRYTVRMSDDDNKRMNAYCEKSGKNRSDVIREALMKYMNESSELV